MLNRRTLLIGAGAASCGLGASGPAAAAPVLGEDGLYHQPWFIESFLELGDDIETARKAGKRLAVIWELKGCPYCKETHFVNFARPDIAAYIKANFDVLQLNMIGARMVTDVDGTQISEKALAGKYGVRFSPTVQFFPESAAGLRDKPVKEREVARATGYLRPDDFLAMFRFVRERAYVGGSFRDFLRAAH
ncbi:MAG: thioredoxin fold domain-containing protein [Proteobacteria bacterium]|nr:thioredoxin fold domain-containing protein [Pseudomonadota bacterium]